MINLNRIKWITLGLIFVLALFVRFYAFKESVYFGFDQARDAFSAQEIYTNHDLKFIGPPVSGDIGLFHGPLYWYMSGPIYLLGGGSIEFVSAVFRVVNALGVFLVFAIAANLFSPTVGLMSAFIYAVSFEQSQYALYLGNPTLGVLSVMLIFLGLSWIYVKKRYYQLSPVVIGLGLGAAVQFNLMYAYLFLVAASGLLILRSEIKKIKVKYWIGGVFVLVFLLSTYLLVEIKYHFRSIFIAVRMLKNGVQFLGGESSKYALFSDKFMTMVKDNLTGRGTPSILAIVIGMVIIIFCLFRALKNKPNRIVFLWMMSWVFLMLFGGHTGYYTNAGLGVGIIIAFGDLLWTINKKLRLLLAVLILSLVLFVNLKEISIQQPRGLILEFIVQPSMTLTDEEKVIDYMYTEANGKSFTVRHTGIPYLVPSVWAYLLDHYGATKWGYYPFWEYGKVIGFPGELPQPTKGTTCLRFRLVEPTRGLPQSIINQDINIENQLSVPIKQKYIGEFLVETRQAKDSYCHNNKPNRENISSSR